MAYHFLPTGPDLDGRDFAAVWRHYEETGFLYPDKLRRLEGLREEWATLWPRLAAASPEVFQFHASHDGGQISGSLSGFRDTSRRFVIQHAASEGRPDLLLQCLMAMTVGVSCTGARYATMFHRGSKRWPARLRAFLLQSLPDGAHCDYEESHWVCDLDPVSTPWRRGCGAEIDEASNLEAVELLRRVWNPLRVDSLGLESEERQRLAALYGRDGLCRQQQLLVARRDGAVAGVGCLVAGSGPLNLSLLCNRVEIALASEEVSHAGAESLVSELVAAAASRFAAVGVRRFSVLLDSAIESSIESASIAAGCRPTGGRYATFVWARDGAHGFVSSAIAFCHWFETLGEMKGRREGKARQGGRRDSTSDLPQQPTPTARAS